MAQRSILSFFKASDQTNVEKPKNKTVVVNDTPVKKPKKRKVQRIESDDESSDIPAKKLNGEFGETSKATDDETEKSTDLNLKVEDIEKNGDVSSRKPSDQQKMENDDEKNSLQSPPKVEPETSCESEKLVAENGETPDSTKTHEASSSKQNGFMDFIPKRKTARKQMSSSRSNKSSVVQIKKQESKTDDEVEIKKASTSVESTNLETEKIDSELKVENNLPASVETAQKNSENKESSKVVQISTGSKHKASVSSKTKGSPLKKRVKKEPIQSVKKESIQSFFTPVKKSEDKGSTEDEKIKISLETNDDDSPVKKVQKKKTHVLESDEEDDDESASKETLVKKEVEIAEMKDNSSAELKDNSSLESKDNSSLESKDNSSTELEDNSSAESKGDSSTELKDNSLTKIKEENSTELKGNNSIEMKDENSLSSKQNETVKSENSEENKTLSDKSTNEKSKTENTNQKFSVKSTSADTAYDPSKSNYHPVKDAFWKVNEKVPYLALAKTLELIENTSGRLKTIEMLSNYFRSVIVLSPDDLLHSIYLCLNRVAPEYEGIEMGVGGTLLMKAVAQATGRTVDKIKAEVAIKGDLGLVSESSRGNQRVMFTPPKLTVSSVFNKFLEIAKMSGNSAMAKKTDKIKTLFVACRDCEAKYIIRSLSGKLRIGMAEQSILCAIARAAVLTPPGQEFPPEKIDTSKGMSADRFKELLDAQTLILKTAYCECPNYDLIIPVLLKYGISALPDHCQLSPGVPLKPMLAHPTDGIDKVLERFDKNAFTCEFKYDGERAQIHMNDKGDVKIFSRNQEDNTSKYPDVISRISSVLKESTKSFILDSEAVAWDKETKQILPFQVLSTRKRKDAKESEIVVQVCIMAFDLLYLNGESLVKKSLKERRSLLHSSFNEVESKFMFAQYRDGNSAETMQEFLDESVKGNCEGLMVKSLEVDASYEIAKRSRNWLKLKKDYLQGIGDTLDLVVIGGYYGKGKRTGNYGGFLLACYDEDNEEFQSICKLGTGFKDDMLEAHTKFLKQHIIKEPKSYFRYDHSLQPDEWFEPVQVWEIKCADLSISPVHKAATGIVDPEKGISLRFPRFIRIRDDKNAEDATNSSQIAEMYQSQQQIQNTANKNAKFEEDFY